MTNAELIKALRNCGSTSRNCGSCFYKNHPMCHFQMAIDAADALEAAERMLDQSTKRCEALRKQLRESHENYEKHLNELEAQLPKEGEWIESNRRPRSAQFYCSVCHRTCYDIQPTRNKAWTKRCRYHYCPSCGARMKGKQE